MATSAPGGGAAPNFSSITAWTPPPYMPAAAGRPPHKALLSGKATEELFVVLVVMAVLGIVAGMVGRMCGGRHVGGDSPLDFEGWVEKQCAACIDGEVDVDPSAAPVNEGELPAAAPAPLPEEPAPADPGVPLEAGCVEPEPPPPPPPEAAPQGAGGISILEAPSYVAQPCHHHYHHHPVPVYMCQSCCKAERLYQPHSSSY